MRIHELLQPLFLYPLACSLAFLRWFCLGLRPIGQHFVNDGVTVFQRACREVRSSVGTPHVADLAGRFFSLMIRPSPAVPNEIAIFAKRKVLSAALRKCAAVERRVARVGFRD